MSEYRKKLILNDSPLNGLGLFAAEEIKKSEVVMLWAVNTFMISEKDYNEAQKSNNQIMIKTGCRYVDGIFLYTDVHPKLENYINHSFSPNMLYHCGICFAKQDIAVGEELTVDYRYILAVDDDNAFIDKKTSQKVDGYDSETCLLKSTEELLKILKI